MRRPIKVRVRRGDKLVTEEAILWIGELPLAYRRGKNKKGKTRRGKQEQQAQLLEEVLRQKEEGTS